ncbi:hypothetical protein [Desulfosporosinus nitroreducens]|uniref:DUF4083 domain-containing protein n=1 Tax=Desulfosporosinus nitroreducens TaxID=2018668 RepID=A0ABT8QYZ6_9FIRM|nr:hypothetical protein [Desulfosporosinus nitroreducens]MCO1602265.1 hypothetical protein [Desulfosporosinus nitroreducens]MDO0825106.1 hypothetical protein [Desulfosporosinus nitroreducens]
MEGNPIQFDFTILATIFSLLLPLLFIYLIVSAIRFFKRKEATDKELVQKLDQLIKLQTQQTENKT